MKRIVEVACAIGIVLFLSACSRGITVKIGVVAPMSGALEKFGKDMAQGAQIAADELNAEKFRIDGKQAHFEILVEDDKGAAEEGKAAAKRLIDAGAVAVFGHLNSTVSIAAAPIYAAAGIPQMSASTNPKYTRMGLKTTFRIGADDVNQGQALAGLMINKLRSKSVFIFDDRTDFGTGLAAEVGNALKQANRNFVHESFEPAKADYAALAQKIKDAGADAVVFAGDDQGGLPLLKALRESGSLAQYLAGDAMCDSGVMKKSQGSANGNFHCTVPGIPPSWLSSGVGFVQMYKSKYGEPGSFSVAAYDGIHVLAQAMQNAQSARPEIYLSHMTQGSFDGKIQGVVEFDLNGNLKDGTVIAYRAVGGALMEQAESRN